MHYVTAIYQVMEPIHLPHSNIYTDQYIFVVDDIAYWKTTESKEEILDQYDGKDLTEARYAHLIEMPECHKRLPQYMEEHPTSVRLIYQLIQPVPKSRFYNIGKERT
jgi:hypothetical protein